MKLVYTITDITDFICHVIGKRATVGQKVLIRILSQGETCIILVIVETAETANILTTTIPEILTSSLRYVDQVAWAPEITIIKD